MLTLKITCFTIFIANFEMCICFLFEPSNSSTPNPALPTKLIATTEKLPPKSTELSAMTSKVSVTSSVVTNVKTTVPTTDYQQLLDMLTEERRKRVYLENQLAEIEQNFTAAVAALSEKMHNNSNSAVNQINVVEVKFEETVKTLEQNVSSTEEALNKFGVEVRNLSNTCTVIAAKNEEIDDRLDNLTMTLMADQAEIAGVKQQIGKRSGFTVSSPRNGPSSGTITFSKVLTNIGNHYNATSGEFTCKYNGIYVFILSLCKDGLSDFAYCNIRLNGMDVMEAYSNPSHEGDYGFYSSGTSLLIHLRIGDTIDLGHCTDAQTLNYRTVFTGFLLKAD